MINTKTIILFLYLYATLACTAVEKTSTNITEYNDSITLKIIGSWSFDLEAMKDNSPKELLQNIEMLSMIGGDLFKIDFHNDRKIVESGLGGINSVGKWENIGNKITVTFEPNEMQQEILNSENIYLTEEIKAPFQREMQLIGSQLIFESTIGPKTLTFYLKK